MNRASIRIALAAATALAFAGSAAADTIKVGIIGPLSGPFALQGKNFKAGVEAYFSLNGKKVGAHEIEVIYRDLPSADPARSKALGQELIVKDKVQYLAGIYFTPDAMALTPLLEQANVPLVIFNAATSAITQKSPLVVRTSFTLWQTTAPMAKVALEKGIKKVAIAISDYGPGVDAENAFKKTFEGGGGQIVDSVRMPLKTTDFSPIMQRARDSGAEAVFAFLPSGPTTLGFVKAFNEAGLKDRKVQLLAPGDLTQESDLPALGDAALGIQTTFHYSVAHESKENQAFVAAAVKALDSPDELSFPAVGAFDGMRVIAKMIEATGGKQDAAKAVEAVKGMAWESPRGPMKIDPETRSPIETIYLRTVERSGGKLINKEIKAYPDVPDLGFAQTN
jgi:branched-chain amino acid transport system substrate-binding protein